MINIFRFIFSANTAGRYRIPRRAAVAGAVGVLAVTACMGCAGGGDSEPDAPGNIPETVENALTLINSDFKATCPDPLDSMPDDDCRKIVIRPMRGPLPKLFNDSNYIHYEVASRIGIDPIQGPADIAHVKRPIERVVSCEDFYVADLKHSYPYLIPEAHALLHEIGRRFNDSLRARGGGNYRLKVTSLLRTSDSVRRLRRVNRCAVDSSVHRFGTTFDISYTRFMLSGPHGVHRSQEDLKNLLAEVVWAAREEGKCFVKYEKFSGCFHITTRDFNGPKRR